MRVLLEGRCDREMDAAQRASQMKASLKLIWLKQAAPGGCSKDSFWDMVTWKPELKGERRLRGIDFYPTLRKVAQLGGGTMSDSWREGWH